MKPTKIVFLKPDMQGGGGLEKASERLVRAFYQAGYDTHLLTTTPFQAPYHVHSLDVKGKGWSRLLSFDHAVKAWLKSNPYNMVFGLDRHSFQTHYRAGNGVHAAYLDRRRKREGWLKKLSFYLNPLHRTLLRLEKQTVSHPSLQALFTNSEMVKQEFLSYYSMDPNKIYVVHNGVEWREMESDFALWQTKRPMLYRSLGLDPSSFQLLFIGHGWKRKGLYPLLKALTLLPRGSLQLSVVGQDKDENEFKALVHALHLEKEVFFFGKQPTVRHFYQIGDALAIPSFYDPFANVTLEALAMGLFVISSKDNGGKEVLTSFSGTVIESLEDPASIAASLQLALKNKKTEASATSIRQSVACFDYPQQLQKVIDLCHTNVST